MYATTIEFPRPGLTEFQEPLTEAVPTDRQRREPGPTIVGDSVAIRTVLEQVRQVSPTPATVLLLGETGVGKELIAETIHDASPRRRRPMIKVNFAAMPAALIESELFGHERGAFTDAAVRRIGRFEAAHGSTILLDEVGELPPEVQVKLLRVLEERTVERLGGNHSRKVDVRIIAATNRDLEEAVAKRTFREDLFYRLNVFPLTIPPLRDRREDIPSLVQTFVDGFAQAYGKRDRRGGQEQPCRSAGVRVARQRARAAQSDRARDDCRHRADLDHQRSTPDLRPWPIVGRKAGRR
jgi:transcriptional regulator with GAF, ATPase, and Fis domain